MKVGKGMKKPYPGSKEAVSLGCTCPPSENTGGKGVAGLAKLYLVSVDCPVHSPSSKRVFATNK